MLNRGRFMMIKVSLIILFSVVTISQIFSQTCVYIRNLDLRAIINERKYGDISVNGCISDETFKPYTVRTINLLCQESKIAVLENNFISNMQALTKFQVDRCNLSTIEPGAFSNLSNLLEISIQDNPLTHISAGVFHLVPSIRLLELFYNRIKTVEDRAFANLPNLEHISLELNRLDHMKVEWFTNTTNIKLFSIGHNFIRKIPQNMFHGWKDLNTIDFTNNRISSIEDETFDNSLSKLKFLIFHQNRLTSFNPKAISNSLYIEFLTISANLLNYLPSEFLGSVRVNFLILFGNPFKCACLNTIYEICLIRNIQVILPDVYKFCKSPDVPVCAVPSRFPKSCTETVDKNVTLKMISRMKSIGYDGVRNNMGHQCAIFDDIEN